MFFCHWRECYASKHELWRARSRREKCKKAFAKGAGRAFGDLAPYPAELEGGVRRPSQFEAVSQLASALGVSASELLDQSDALIIDAAERGGSDAARDVASLVSECCGLFAGGELDEEEKDGIMAALTEAYWIAKRANAKYAKKK